MLMSPDISGVVWVWRHLLFLFSGFAVPTSVDVLRWTHMLSLTSLSPLLWVCGGIPAAINQMPLTLQHLLCLADEETAVALT